MKSFLLILSVLALLAPSAAQAAVQFELGGYVKLETFWDSTQTNKDMSIAIARNNDQLFHHGRFNMRAQHSRLNFKVKGPHLWGATTLSFIEFDFEGSGSDPLLNASHAFVPRLRHAWFELAWPETELRFGQAYAILDEFRIEGVRDTIMQFSGATSYRVPQIKLTQRFLGPWSVAGSINKPTDPAVANDAGFFNTTTAPAPAAPAPAGTTLGLEGQSAETPNLQAMIRYEKDLWGKGPHEGRPRGFTAQVSGGWQRLRYRSGASAAAAPNVYATFGQNQFQTFAAGNVIQRDQQNLDPWMVMVDLFIPVLPTHTPKLAGSASLLTQWYIGQGLQPFGFGRSQDQSWLKFAGIGPDGTFLYDRQLTRQFGGFVQGQYYFTNEWYVNMAWGMMRPFGVDRSISGLLAGRQPNNPVGYKYAANSDQVKSWQEFDLTLFFNPIKALKFGVQYTYARTDWLQRVNNPAVGAIAPNGADFPNAGAKDVGEAHRLMGAAWFYF